MTLEKILVGLLTMIVLAIIILSLTSCVPSGSELPKVDALRTEYGDGVKMFIDHDQHVVCYYMGWQSATGWAALSCVPQYGYR